MSLNKIIQLYKSKRIKGIVRKIINKFYSEEYLYKANIIDKYSYKNNEFSLQELNLEILNEMIYIYPNEIDMCKYNILKKRLSNHTESTYIVFEEKEICGYFNIAYNDVIESGANLLINVPEDSIYLYDDYTFIKHRRKGVHKFSVINRFNIGKNVGRKYAYVVISLGNIASEKDAENFSFKRIKKYSCFRIGKIKRSFEKVLW